MTRRALLALLAALPLGCRRPPAHLRVTFLDVGQGDATVIECPSGEVIVVDGGGIPQTDERWGGDPGTRIVVPCLRSRGISTVDLLVGTHPDDDHIQGLSAVVLRLRVRAALESGFPAPDGPCARWRAAMRSRGIPITHGQRGQTWRFGATELAVLHPQPRFLTGTHSDTNNNALVLRLTHGNVRFLLMADAEAEAEVVLLASGQNLRADVLKVGHHGSRTSTSAALLTAVDPALAVISCGRENRFGHPHPEVLARLAGRTVLRTDQRGAIALETDGARLWQA